MTQTETVNRQLVLAERPKGEPTKDTLRLVEGDVPSPGAGQMLLRTEYLSLDPYMRGRMSDAPSYAAPVEIDGVMEGGTVAQVVTSQVDGFAPGDWVLSFNGWQDYALSDGAGLTNLGKSPAHPSWALGIMGMPGFTAWAGLTQIGAPKPGETIAVAAATGPVGATVGQIGKILGCRVVGIAGGEAKCDWVVKELGFDACIDYKAGAAAVRDGLKQHCPKGVDIYFDNVGGEILDLVLARIARKARIIICGAISQYNNANSMPAAGPRNYLSLLVNRARMEGIVVFDYADRYPVAIAELAGYLKDGRMKSKEDIVQGLDTFPEALNRLFSGANFGKLVLQVATE